MWRNKYIKKLYINYSFYWNKHLAVDSEVLCKSITEIKLMLSLVSTARIQSPVGSGRTKALLKMFRGYTDISYIT